MHTTFLLINLIFWRYTSVYKFSFGLLFNLHHTFSRSRRKQSTVNMTKKKKENRNLSYFSSRDRFESNCWLQDNLVKVIKNGNWIKPVEIVDGSILSFMAPFVLPSFLFIYRKPRSKKRTFTRMRPMKRATLLERKKYIYIYRRDRGIEI